MRRYIVDERETVGVFVSSFYTEKKREKTIIHNEEFDPGSG